MLSALFFPGLSRLVYLSGKRSVLPIGTGRCEQSVLLLTL